MIRLAVRLPTPGADARAATSPEATAICSLAGSSAESKERPRRGPTPETPVSRPNRFREAASAKP